MMNSSDGKRQSEWRLGVLLAVTSGFQPAGRSQSASLSSPSPKTRTNVSALFAARLEMGTGGNAVAVRVPPSVAAA